MPPVAQHYTVLTHSSHPAYCCLHQSPGSSERGECGIETCRHQAALQQFRYELYLEMRQVMQAVMQHAVQQQQQRKPGRVARRLLSEFDDTEQEDDPSSENCTVDKQRSSDSERSVSGEGSNTHLEQLAHVMQLVDSLGLAALGKPPTPPQPPTTSTTTAPATSALAPVLCSRCSSNSVSTSPLPDFSTASRTSDAPQPRTLEVASADDDYARRRSSPSLTRPATPSVSLPTSPALSACSTPSELPTRNGTKHFSVNASTTSSGASSPRASISQGPSFPPFDKQLERAAAPAASKIGKGIVTSPSHPSLPLAPATPLSTKPVPPSPAPFTPSTPSTPSKPATVIVRSTYLLTAIDSIPVATGRCFLSINLTAAESNPRGLQVVESEQVKRHIDMSRIVRCNIPIEDEHVLCVTYLRPPAGSTGVVADKALTVQAEAEYRLSSALDAQHVRALLAAIIAASASTATPATPASVTADPASPTASPVTPSSTDSSSSGVPASPRTPPAAQAAVLGQECLQKGWVEHCSKSDRGTIWTKRFARLYSNRLLLFRSASAPLPLNVYPLTVDGRQTRAAVSSLPGFCILMECANSDSGARSVIWRCKDEESHREWMWALHMDGSGSAAAARRKVDVSTTPPDTPKPTAGPAPSIAVTAHDSTSLSPLMSSQRAFMSYLLELSASQPLFPSALPTSAVFQQQTVGSFLRKRHPTLHTIDKALSSYHHLLPALCLLWSEARLLMVDALEQSGSGQVGFSFPGFDTQVFDVGKLCVIACGQLLSSEPHALLFTKHDFQLALESSSPAKEMMQSSPDLDVLYARGEKEQARALAAQSQRLLLHHCALASYVKSHQAELRCGDIVSWDDVIASVGAGKNSAVLELYRPVAYLYNPSLTALHRVIAQIKAKRKLDLNAPYASFPANPTPAPAGPGHSRAGSGSSTPVQPSTPSSGSNHGGQPAFSFPPASPTSAGANLSKPGFFSRSKSSAGEAASKSTPSTPVASSPVAGPAVPPLSPPSPSSSHAATELRCLADPIHLVLLLRTLLHYRRHALSSLLSTLAHVLEALSESSSSTERAAVAALQAEAEKEKQTVMTVLAALPRQEEIEREDKKERRERRERREEKEARRAMRARAEDDEKADAHESMADLDERIGGDLISVPRRVHRDELERALVVPTVQDVTPRRR